jgi:hypothetical protein
MKRKIIKEKGSPGLPVGPTRPPQPSNHLHTKPTSNPAHERNQPNSPLTVSSLASNKKETVVFLLFSTLDSEPTKLRHVLAVDKDAAGRQNSPRVEGNSICIHCQSAHHDSRSETLT